MKKIKRKLWALAVSFLLIGVSLYIGSVSPIEETASISYETRPVIIVDAGHGGYDGGAQANDGTQEKNINLSIARKLHKYLSLGGFNVILTRDKDEGIEEDSTASIAKRKVGDMKKRLQIINDNPDAVFVSIHLNKFTTSSPNGTQVFYSPNNEKSFELATEIQKSVVNNLQKDNERQVKKGDKSIYLLKNATIPAVIVECGFLSNADELKLLKNEEYQSKMAFSIYCGILEYYN